MTAASGATAYVVLLAATLGGSSALECKRIFEIERYDYEISLEQSCPFFKQHVSCETCAGRYTVLSFATLAYVPPLLFHCEPPF